MAFWPGQRTCGDDRVFAVGTNAKKVASRALRSIFCYCRESKMEIPVDYSVCHGAYVDEIHCVPAFPCRSLFLPYTLSTDRKLSVLWTSCCYMRVCVLVMPNPW